MEELAHHHPQELQLHILGKVQFSKSLPTSELSEFCSGIYASIMRRKTMYRIEMGTMEGGEYNHHAYIHFSPATPCFVLYCVLKIQMFKCFIWTSWNFQRQKLLPQDFWWILGRLILLLLLDKRNYKSAFFDLKYLIILHFCFWAKFETFVVFLINHVSLLYWQWITLLVPTKNQYLYQFEILRSLVWFYVHVMVNLVNMVLRLSIPAVLQKN